LKTRNYTQKNNLKQYQNSNKLENRLLLTDSNIGLTMRTMCLKTRPGVKRMIRTMLDLRH